MWHIKLAYVTARGRPHRQSAAEIRRRSLQGRPAAPPWSWSSQRRWDPRPWPWHTWPASSGPSWGYRSPCALLFWNFMVSRKFLQLIRLTNLGEIRTCEYKFRNAISFADLLEWVQISERHYICRFAWVPWEAGSIHHDRTIGATQNTRKCETMLWDTNVNSITTLQAYQLYSTRYPLSYCLCWSWTTVFSHAGKTILKMVVTIKFRVIFYHQPPHTEPTTNRASFFHLPRHRSAFHFTTVYGQRESRREDLPPAHTVLTHTLALLPLSPTFRALKHW